MMYMMLNQPLMLSRNLLRGVVRRSLAKSGIYCLICLLIYPVGVYSGVPVWSIVPLSSDEVYVPINGIGVKKYRVTNNSKRTHTLVVVPVSGVSQHTGDPDECSYPFVLAQYQSCILSLQLSGSALMHSGTLDSPIVCVSEGPPNHNPSSFMCYKSLSAIPYKIYYPLSIYGIPDQLATANTEFSFNAHDKIAYYDENVQSGHPPIVGFIPVGNAPSFAELGLSFDPATLILSGVPNQAGQFDYQVVAHNDYSTAAPVNFRLNVDYNQHDKPRFRANFQIPVMAPANAFRFNLLNLLESNSGFMLSNQVSFMVDNNRLGPNPAKIKIDSNGVDLVAEPPNELAGQTLKAYITAHSNTGGDSEQVEIQLPVALDAAMKPVINEGIQLTAHAGENIKHNLQANIVDPAQDANLRLVIDKVEPFAPWLSVSSSEPTTLVGNVPTDATGQQYILTLHANNQKGGDSIAQTVKLNIDVDEQRKPQFKQDNPVLDILYPGQVYFYDFQQNRDIFPEYEDAPYTIKFAEGYSHPDWLVIENNQLKSIGVVPNVDDDEVIIHVVVYNQPGGQSDVVTLPIFVMN